MRYVSGIFLDFDNVYSSLYRRSSKAAKAFASDPGLWLDALQNMRGTENDETSHNFVIRRCYMNPAGRVPDDKDFFSRYRQPFVRDGWEVIDTPPLTNQGKTSADIHIVMDVLDTVAHHPHVDEYVVFAADADYTPLVIRLRKYLKKTVIYAARYTSGAYRAACDSVIDENDFLELFEEAVENVAPKKLAESPLVTPPKVSPPGTVSVSHVADTLQRYFTESGVGYSAPLATVGHRLMKTYGKEISDGWLGQKTLSRLLKSVGNVEMINEDGAVLVRLAQKSATETPLQPEAKGAGNQ
jgi:hypothetical protein